MSRTQRQTAIFRQRVPFAGVQAFINDFHAYITPREPVTTSTLTRYRESQGACATCGMTISDAARLDCGSCAA